MKGGSKAQRPAHISGFSEERWYIYSFPYLTSIVLVRGRIICSFSEMSRKKKSIDSSRKGGGHPRNGKKVLYPNRVEDVSCREIFDPRRRVKLKSRKERWEGKVTTLGHDRFSVGHKNLTHVCFQEKSRKPKAINPMGNWKASSSPHHLGS